MTSSLRWCWAVVLAMSSIATAQSRFTLDSMEWSVQPPQGWVSVTGATLDAIRQDLLQGPGGADARACWAKDDPGSLPRIVVTMVSAQIESPQAAEDIVSSLAGETDPNDPSRFSLSSALASFDGEVLVLTEAMVGANGIVQLVAYTRDADAESTREALDAMVQSARFAKGAGIPDPDSVATNRVVDWGIRGAIIGAMIAVIIFGVRVLRAMWSPPVAQDEG